MDKKVIRKRIRKSNNQKGKKISQSLIFMNISGVKMMEYQRVLASGLINRKKQLRNITV